MKFKKIGLGFGAATAVIAPIASVVACGPKVGELTLTGGTVSTAAGTTTFSIAGSDSSISADTTSLTEAQIKAIYAKFITTAKHGTVTRVDVTLAKDENTFKHFAFTIASGVNEAGFTASATGATATAIVPA